MVGWWTASPVAALFTGSDQYDRADLNSESRVDLEYALHLLAFRPFWEPAPLDPNPKALIRTTEASLSTDDLYIRREAEFRLPVSSGVWWGYALRQLEDYEQSSFDQAFAVRAGAARGPGLRFFGQPTAKKQDSDIGVGLDWQAEEGRALLAMRVVDFNFNEKNKADDFDRRRLYTLRAEAGWRWGETAVEGVWDLDTPVERELPEDDERFNHRAWASALALRNGPWSVRGYWENHRRSVDSLGTGVRQQDFHKVAGGLRVEQDIPLAMYRLRPGLGLERRWTNFSASVLADDRKDRWQAEPYVEFDWSLTHRLSVPLGVYGAAGWDADGHCSAEATLRTPLRIDFTPDIRLVLNATWDIDEIGSTRTFDGGNVQFEGRLW